MMCCQRAGRPSPQDRGGQACQGRGVSVAQASRDLDVHENVLRKWVKEFGSDPAQAFPGHGQMKPEQQEIERLRREVTKLKAERDILKKAAAFFAKEAT
jgi:transposase